MSRSLFENSKAALAFAAITLVGAVSMVGTSENGGMLPKLAERFGNKSAAAQPSGDAPSEVAPSAPPEKKQVPGWYDAPDQAPVFGDFDGTDPDAGSAPDVTGPAAGTSALPAAPPPGPAAKPGSGPMHAPLSPTAVIVN